MTFFTSSEIPRYKIRVCIIYIRAYLTNINGDNQKFWLHPKCIRCRALRNISQSPNPNLNPKSLAIKWGAWKKYKSTISADLQNEGYAAHYNSFKCIQNECFLSSSCYLFSYLAPPHSGCINCRSDISMGFSGNVGLKMVLYTKLAELHGEL